MKNNKNQPIVIKPVKNYTAPQIPTLGDNNTAMLKKLPTRWQKNAKVVACAGIIGTLTLAGLASPLQAGMTQHNMQNESILVDSQSPARATLNGQEIEFDIPPMIINDRVMVPVRAIFNALGLEVEWDNNTQTAIGTGESLTIKIPISSSIASVNNETAQLVTPAIIYNDRTFVPLRFVAEATGANVEWDGAARTAIITTELPPDISAYVLATRMHGGGAPPIPFYVVHLTEQEVLNIIREQFEAVGVNLNAPPPEDTAVVRQRVLWPPFVYNPDSIEYTIRETDVSIDMFDSGLGIGVVKVGGQRSDFASLVPDAFAEQVDGLTVGAFYNPESFLRYGWGDETPPTAADIAKAGELARENFLTQIQTFINFLRTEGIIE